MSNDNTQVSESNSARKRRLAAEHNAARQANSTPDRSISFLSREEVEELKTLSKFVFGSTSRWQKLVNSGHSELVTEEVTELVPGKTDEEEPTTRKVQVPAKKNGVYQHKMKYYTVDSVYAYMMERKAQIEQVQAQIKKMQEEAKAKKEAERLAKLASEELQGSAV